MFLVRVVRTGGLVSGEKFNFKSQVTSFGEFPLKGVN